MAEKTDAERIKALQALGDQLDAVRKRATELCQAGAAEIRRARKARQPERRVKTVKVKRDRRRAVETALQTVTPPKPRAIAPSRVR